MTTKKTQATHEEDTKQLYCDTCGKEVDSESDYWQADDGEIACLDCAQLSLFEEMDENGNPIQ